MKEPNIDCGHTCPAFWVHACIHTAGHRCRHSDWTGRSWTDEEIARMEERRKAKETE